MARAVAGWLQEAGFTPYVAIEAQSIQDVNSGIIHELKSADYYLFIDFRRETLLDAKVSREEPVFRGSLFTHQELAIAHVLDFPHAIFLRQKGTELAGLGRYMLTNAKEFSCSTEVVGLVKRLVTERMWSSFYSRHLVITDFIRHESEENVNESRHDDYKEYHWLAFVANRRPDLRATRTIARLVAVSDVSGEEIELHKKAQARLSWPVIMDGYVIGGNIHEVDLLPGESEAFRAFVTRSGERPGCLSWDEDVVHIGYGCIQGPGEYRVQYQVLAEGFPPLEFAVEINITGKAETATGRLR